MAILKDLDDRQMPLLDHLIELRNRLMYSCIAIFIGFAICYFFAQDIYQFLVQPLADIYQGQTGKRMIYTGLTEAFFTYVKVAFWAGAFLTFPFVATQLWLFIAPGLYRTEKRAFLPFLVATGEAIVRLVIFDQIGRGAVGPSIPHRIRAMEGLPQGVIDRAGDAIPIAIAGNPPRSGIRQSIVAASPGAKVFPGPVMMAS